MTYRTLDPYSGELLETCAIETAGSIDAALDRSANAWARWRATPVARRTELLRAIAGRLDAEIEGLAATMATEMGKPVAQGRAEVKKCAWACRYYADVAAGLLAPQERESDGAVAFVRYEPLGGVLAVMPWNFPLWQLFRFAAPALAAGNVVLLKPAPNTPRCALAIERIVREAAGDPDLVIRLLLSNEQVAGVIARPEVAAVTLTGSSAAGRAVGAAAGAALKPAVLELGGSDPFIVLDDADLERAVEVGVAARCLNSGQSCIAAKRFLVHEAIYDRFREAFVAGMNVQRSGNPMDETTQIGPLAREDLRDLLAAQVADAVGAGARLLCGGGIPEGPGFFYPPTVLEEVPRTTRVFREELFGPVASLHRIAGDEAAIALANDSPYGLGASVWTGDPARATEFVERLETGSVFVNGLVKSDPRLPFGGVKESGFGRELSIEGLREFVNVKTVWYA